MNRAIGFIVIGGAAILLLVVVAQSSGLLRRSEKVKIPDPGDASARDLRELEVVTLLSYDAIPAIDEPEFMSVEAARQFFKPDERVLGISLNGEHHVYSVPMLSQHEIVNDVVGGVPVAVTW